MNVENSEIFQFADDLCVIAWGKKLTETTETLQRAVNAIIRLINDLGMQVSPLKSKAIWFNARREIFHPVIRIDNVEIEFVTSVKYLGIYLDERLNFQKHINELLVAVEKRLNILKMLAGSKWGGQPSTLLTILKSVFRGKIDYGCLVYGGAGQKWLNKLTVAYNRGLRICLRSLRTTTIEALEVEAGSIPTRKFSRLTKGSCPWQDD